MLEVDLQVPAGAKWAPTFYTPTEGKYSKGAAVAAFAEAFLRIIDDEDDEHPPVRLTEFQKWQLMRLLETNEDGRLKLREALIMLPRKNGKTFLIAIIMLYMLCFAPDHAQMYSAAKDLKQAQNVFRMVKAWIDYSPELSKVMKIRESDSMIINRFTGAFYRAVPADTASMHGTNPYFVIVDELHGMVTKKHHDFVESLTTGSGARKESLVVYISTAGAVILGSLLGEMYLRGKDIAQGKYTASNFAAFIWEASPDADIEDPEVWLQCNPMLAEGVLSMDFMRGQLEKAKKRNPAFFLRYFLNIWASVAGDPFIHPHAWSAICDKNADIPKGAKVVAGFDGAYVKGDSAVITYQDIDTGVLKIWQIWERPADADPNWHLSRREVEKSFQKLAREHDMKIIFCDKFYYENDLKEWADEYGWDVMFIHQGGSRMMDIAYDFQKDIAEQVITQTDQEPLNRHVANTYGDDNKGFAKEDKNSPNKIDACVAAMLCNGARNYILDVDDTPTAFMRW